MARKLRVSIAAAALLAVAAFSIGRLPAAGRAEAAYGAAANLNAYTQTCMGDGTVSLNISWSSSGLGTQYLDMSSANDGFATTAYWSMGPLAPGLSSTGWNSLQPGTWYYMRVNTLTGAGWMPTGTVSFYAQSCSGASYGTSYGSSSTYNSGGYTSNTTYSAPVYSTPVYVPVIVYPVRPVVHVFVHKHVVVHNNMHHHW